MIIDECRLCRAIHGPERRRIENTVLYESEHYVVMPTLGQFVEGWLMIVSKNHTRCLREHRPDEVADFELVLAFCKRLLGDAYGNVIVFEHGPGVSPRTKAGCCVEHTHVHIAPLSSPERFLQYVPFEMVPLDSPRALPSLSSSAEGYLLVGCGLSTSAYLACSVTTPIPGQFLRRVLAVCCGQEEAWDWRLHPVETNIRKTIARLLLLLARPVGARHESGTVTCEVAND